MCRVALISQIIIQHPHQSLAWSRLDWHVFLGSRFTRYQCIGWAHYQRCHAIGMGWYAAYWPTDLTFQKKKKSVAHLSLSSPPSLCLPLPLHSLCLSLPQSFSVCLFLCLWLGSNRRPMEYWTTCLTTWATVGSSVDCIKTMLKLNPKHNLSKT